MNATGARRSGGNLKYNLTLSSLLLTGMAWFSFRKSKIHELPDNDYLLNTTIFTRFNPFDNPIMKNLYTRQVAIKHIKPELLVEKGKLVEEFTVAWTRSQDVSKSQKRPWKIVAKTEDSIILHAVGAKRHTMIWRRNKDGLGSLLEARADVRHNEGVVDFSVKTIVCQADGRGNEPFNVFERWNHDLWYKVLVEASASHCMRYLPFILFQ